MKLKRSLKEILQDLTVKSTSGSKYSMTRYRGKRGLFDVSIEALTFRDKSRSYRIGIYQRTQVKPDTQEYRNLLKKHGHLRQSSDKIVSVPFLAKQVEKPEDVFKLLKDLNKAGAG